MISVLILHFGTTHLFWYRPLISVPPIYSGTDRLNMYQLYSKFEIRINFASSYPTETWMKPSLAQGISHLERSHSNSAGIKARHKGSAGNIAYEPSRDKFANNIFTNS